MNRVRRWGTLLLTMSLVVVMGCGSGMTSPTSSGNLAGSPSLSLSLSPDTLRNQAAMAGTVTVTVSCNCGEASVQVNAGAGCTIDDAVPLEIAGPPVGPGFANVDATCQTAPGTSLVRFSTTGSLSGAFATLVVIQGP